MIFIRSDQYHRCHLESLRYESTVVEVRITSQLFLFLLVLITVGPKSFPILQKKGFCSAKGCNDFKLYFINNFLPPFSL